MRRYAFISVALGGLLFFGAGCITIGPSASVSGDGGVFKTTDKGDSWAQKTAVPTTTGDKASINTVSVGVIVQDPQDAKAVYVGTAEHGLFYTYDGGESWRQPLQISRGRVWSIAVNPKDKCEVYATSANRVFKTTDCSRTWDVTYIDTRTDKMMTALVIDHFNPQVVWIANNGGDLLRSGDGGLSWSPAQNFESEVRKIVIRADDSRRLYVATKAAGVWRTVDAGATWEDMSETYIKDHSGAKEFYDIAVGDSSPETVVIASKYGLLRSMDGGTTWHAIDLLTPPGQTVIYSLAIDPKDANNIYYGTSTTFHRSPNGGVNWVPKKLPTSRAATALLVDSSSPSVLYMGVTKFK